MVWWVHPLHVLYSLELHFPGIHTREWDVGTLDSSPGSWEHSYGYSSKMRQWCHDTSCQLQKGYSLGMSWSLRVCFQSCLCTTRICLRRLYSASRSGLCGLNNLVGRKRTDGIVYTSWRCNEFLQQQASILLEMLLYLLPLEQTQHL